MMQEAALALATGRSRSVINRKGSIANYREVIAHHRGNILDFLASEVQSITLGRRTVRPGSPRLVRPSIQKDEPILLLVACDAGREEGDVTRIGAGDYFYRIVAENATTEGFTLSRIR